MQFATKPPGPLRPRHPVCNRALAAAGWRPHCVGQFEWRTYARRSCSKTIHFLEARIRGRGPAYGQSKTAKRTVSRSRPQKRWAADGDHRELRCTPGGDPDELATVRLRRGPSTAMRRAAGSSGANWKTPEQGRRDCRSWSQPHHLLDGVGGHYFEDCTEAAPNQPGHTPAEVAAYALDPGRPPNGSGMYRSRPLQI